jgi:glycosyltransferase involved in cell wall biosynthesis
MRIVQIMNWHRFGGGADFVAVATGRVLESRGHTVRFLSADSRKLEQVTGRVRAFANGVYSFAALRDARRMLAEFQPDLAHVHEVFPSFSPWVLKTLSEAGVPVVMTCHDFRLTCPVATHLRRGKPCTKCARGSTLWCALHNCRNNACESIAYAARSYVARRFELFERYISRFITPSEFLKRRMVEAGWPEERFEVVPNPVDFPSEGAPPIDGEYIAFVGRVAPEKGLGILMEAARATGFPVQIAGDASVADSLKRHAPPNVRFIGPLDRPALRSFYRNARLVVVPSIFEESFGLVAAEAMSHGVPVIAARTGALPELIDDGETGLLFSPGNVAELAAQLRELWEAPDRRRQMGTAGRFKAWMFYSDRIYYARLMKAYGRAAAAARVDVSRRAAARPRAALVSERHAKVGL